MLLRPRVFLLMFVASCFIAICVFVAQDWIFLRYHTLNVKANNRQRLENLSVALNRTYAEQGSWAAVHGDDALWAKLLAASLNAKSSGVHQGANAMGNPKRSEPLRYGPNGLQFDKNVLLLDAERKLVFGPVVRDERIDFTPIIHQSRIVGYVGLRDVGNVIDPRKIDVVVDQITIALIASASFIIAAGFSLLLANRILIPVKALTTALHDLSAGRLDTRVDITCGGELGLLARDFNHLALSMEKCQQMRCQNSADISHELRTPLTVMRIEIEAILEGVRPVTIDAVASLYGEVVQLNRLVEDLYQLSLSDIGALTYNKGTWPLADILCQAVESFRNNFADDDIALQIDAQESRDVLVHADRDRLHQLFDNLLKNSLKYTDPGGVLNIRMECREKVVVIRFEDSAPGIPTTELPRLFDRLYRANKSREREPGGAGLGLAICRNIVDAHEGRIAALHSPLGGLCVRIELPLLGRAT